MQTSNKESNPRRVSNSSRVSFSNIASLFFPLPHGQNQNRFRLPIVWLTVPENIVV